MATDATHPEPPASARGPRPIAWTLAVVSFVLLLVSGYTLAQRMGAYNQAHPRPLWVFKRVERREFTFADRTVTLTDNLDASGAGTVTLTYADATLELPVQVPSEHDLPGLSRHRNWLAVLAFADATGVHGAEVKRQLESGELAARMVAVVREPNAGVGSDPLMPVDVDEESWGWGEVMRRRTTFAFHELLPEGGFRSERLRFPESARSYDRRVAEAVRAGEPVPERDPGELAERTWQYDAALALTNRPPSITHEQQALRNAGWTLPVASASVLVLMLSLAWAIAPPKRTV
ncbi:MAG: hypothetical protein DHS20C14_13030 [Phycisphaeraceae bacterium]|nr:MAG: hypothetical protein DHS20C14_13030 [Phycisphaeraceae bacterium]